MESDFDDGDEVDDVNEVGDVDEFGDVAEDTSLISSIVSVKPSPGTLSTLFGSKSLKFLSSQTDRVSVSVEEFVFKPWQSTLNVSSSPFRSEGRSKQVRTSGSTALAINDASF